MKKIMLLFSYLLMPAVASAQIAGSAHDFSGEGWSRGEICITCHTPHNADTTIDAALWNHTVSTALYTLYDSPTMDAAPAQPGTASLVCLSCHDGTVALDSFGGATGGTMIDPAGDLTTDLSDDHPVGILWTHQTQTPTCGQCHNQHNPNWPQPLPFYEERVECATCHDVHNSNSAIPYFLRISNAGSDLCFHCHGK